MKIDNITQEVIRLIEDRGYDAISLLGKINLALIECVAKVDVPDLKTLVRLTTATDSGYVSLRNKISQFGGRIKRIRYEGADLRRYTSIDDMLIDYNDLETAGDITGYCQEGDNLWYAKIPETAVSLLVLCYQNPEPLSTKNDEVLWMPEHCQYKILVGGACGYIFDEKEEEDSGKPVTRRYEKMFNDGLTDLREWISKNRTNLTYSAWTE